MINLLLPISILISTITNGQHSIIESEYIYTSKGLSFHLPDSVKESIQIPSTGNIVLKMGDIRYVNLCSKSRSYTVLSFEEAKGFEFLKETGSAYTENNVQQSTYRSFENGSTQKHLFYYMPEIKKGGEKKKINGYESCLYTYTNPAKITYKIWVSDQISFLVNPGFYFQSKGGITKIEFTINNSVWCLDLKSFRENKNVAFSSETLTLPADTTKKLHPFFDAK